MRDPDIVEFVDQRDGILKFRQTGADHQTVDRGARLTRLLHQALSADLQLPQVGIQEQGVELDHPTGIEQRAQFCHPPIKDRLGHLAATGEFRPVPRIGGSSDDAGVDRSGRHPGQQDRRIAREPSELRGQLDRTVRQADRRGRIARPRSAHLRRGTDGEQVALTAAGGSRHDAHP